MAHPERRFGLPPDGILEASARRADQRRAENSMRLRAESLSVPSAATATGASERHLMRLVKSGDAVAVVDGGRVLLPPWQLQRNAVAPVIPGSSEILRAFPADLPTLHAWMGKPTAELDGAAPADALRDGQAACVIALAKAIGAAGR